MPKFTKRNKKHNKNKTIRGGAESEGVMDIIGDNVSDMASNVINKIENVGLEAMGLQKIGETKSQSQSSNSALNTINNVLGSEVVSEHVKSAGEETAAITSKLADDFNAAMDDPIIKAKVEKAIENAGEISTVVAKAAEEPLKEVAKVGVEAGTKALSAASSGAIKVGTDMMAAIPGVGGIIELGKIINDSSKAASAIVEAGSDAIQTASDAFTETSENVKKGLNDLEEQKKLATQISNRTTRSINQFENPINIKNTITGGKKTKKRFFKRRHKSKRVRFHI